MISAKQKNIKIFHISTDSFDEFAELYKKNGALIRHYLIVLEGKESGKIHSFLEQEGVLSLIKRDNFPKYSSLKQEISYEKIEKERSSDKIQEVTTNPHPSKMVINKTLRSGVEIEHIGPLTLFGRVNDGAKLSVKGDLEVFGDIDGFVECEGDYFILKGVIGGSVIYNGEILENQLFDGKLKMVTIKDGKVEVLEL